MCDVEEASHFSLSAIAFADECCLARTHRLHRPRFLVLQFRSNNSHDATSPPARFVHARIFIVKKKRREKRTSVFLFTAKLSLQFSGLTSCYSRKLSTLNKDEVLWCLFSFPVASSCLFSSSLQRVRERHLKFLTSQWRSGALGWNSADRVVADEKHSVLRLLWQLL